MFRDKKLIILYIFFFLFYASFGSSSLAPKYYIEIGMTESQIGMLTSLPSLVAMCFMPIWGTWSDRVRYKRIIVFITLLLSGITCFFVNSFLTYIPLLLSLIVFSIFQQPANPTATAIAIEYTNSTGKKFGPIRMTGTIGFQVFLLVVGVVFAVSLKGLYNFLGIITIIAAFISLALPPVEGHQHSKGKKVPMSALLKNRRIRWLLLIVFIGTITSMFYNSFFTAHLGQLGVSNVMTSVISILSIVLEIPMLLLIDKIMKKRTVWQWLLIGFVLNGVRWLGLSLTENVWLILVCQIPAITVLGCFEYIPQQYINKIADDEQTGAAQSALNLVNFGLARVVGALIGGRISEWVGIQTVFGFNGVMLLVATLLLLIPCRKLSKADKEEGIA